MVAPGTPVSSAPAPLPSKAIKLVGKHVTIVPVSPSHAEEMFTRTSGPASKLFDHMFDGPYASVSEYASKLAEQAADPVTYFYTILLNPKPSISTEQGKAEVEMETKHEAQDGRPVGRAALMRIDITHRVLEVGHILYSPLLQQTPAATEAMSLLASYVFDTLGYRRYEWKCNSLNEPSRRAARRLGFREEGVFRQHMIQRGRSRDTAWFAMVDEDWVEKGGVKEGFERWLDEGNFDGEGRQRRRLEECRRG